MPQTQWKIRNGPQFQKHSWNLNSPAHPSLTARQLADTELSRPQYSQAETTEQAPLSDKY